MRRLCIVALIALAACPALAQTKPVPRYGETDKPKTPAEIESERAAEAAYRRSLGNVPNASGPSDPWGGVRDGGTKPAPAKPAKSQTTAK